MNEIGELLRRIRGKDSLREAAKKTGLSHGYISIIEKGIDPRTRSPIKPSPESLKSYSDGYGYPYKELMEAAGYIGDNFITKPNAKDNIDPKKRVLFDEIDKLSEEDAEYILDLIRRIKKD